MTALSRKALRDLRRLWAQVATIAVVIACGIGAFIGLRSTYGSLRGSMEAYYAAQRFGDAFVRVKRAPDTVAPQLEEIPGVATVYTRLAEEVRLPMPGLPEPASGRVISLPADGSAPPLGGLHLRAGRWIDPARDDEALVLEAFAAAHGLRPGDRLSVVLNGKLRVVRVAGIALSPEYVFAQRPGALMDDKRRFAVLWMSRTAIAPAFEREGAFDDVVVALQPGASADAVLAELERRLAPWGPLSAVPRARQDSHHVLAGELGSIEQLATTVPGILLAVAAFLVNMVMARLIALQRQELAALKALGYRNREIGLHYLVLVFVTVAVGIGPGVAIGVAFGRWMTGLYGSFFRFPVLAFQVNAPVAIGAIAVSIAAAGGGALLSIRAALRLPPAEAMRPPVPRAYRRSLLDRAGIAALLGTTGMMVFREVTRRPLRTLLSALGIAAASAVVILGRFSYDALDHLLSEIIVERRREDVTVSFLEPLSVRAGREIAHLPGVLEWEGSRVVPVRATHGTRARDVPLVAFPDRPRLRKVVTRDGRDVTLPADAFLVSRKLGEILGLAPGEALDVEIREGERGRVRLPVAGFVDDAFGLSIYGRMSAIEARLGQERALSAVLLRVDPPALPALLAALERRPQVASVDRTQAEIDGIRAQTGESIGVITFVVTAFGICIAVGVVYNTARIALSQRSRDLASLRVLGLSRGEISAILLGEMAIQIGLAVPLGMLLGRLWAGLMAQGMDAETMRFPVVIAPVTYFAAAAVAVAAGAASALWVRRRLDRLDLIAVLKTRE